MTVFDRPLGLDKEVTSQNNISTKEPNPVFEHRNETGPPRARSMFYEQKNQRLHRNWKQHSQTLFLLRTWPSENSELFSTLKILVQVNFYGNLLFFMKKDNLLINYFC